MESINNSVVKLHAQLMKIVHAKEKPVFSLEEVKAEYAQIEGQLIKLYKRNTDETEDEKGAAE